MKLFTIGFTKKSAEAFFTALQRATVSKIVDVRLNNVSQLAGFTKKNDLRYFAKTICGIDYIHLPDFAPTQEMLDEYKKARCTWSDYEGQFLKLMATRQVERTDRELLEGGCFLCSEPLADRCHRRLVVEYLSGKWEGVEIIHL
jgi:uncharacterized protein (DUF488 family)